MHEQIGRVFRHQVSVIVARRVELFALSVSAVVERHDAAPCLSESRDPARIDPVDAMVRGEAVNEQDRLVQVAPLRLGVDEGDVDAIRRKMPELGDAPEMSVLHGRLLDARIETTVRTFA
jgi:hypothetical protein